MRERGGRVVAMPVEGTDAAILQKTVREHVAAHSTIHTDQFPSYLGLGADYDHESVNHRDREFVRDGVTTNGIESVFAVLKRGLIGVYHHASEKHLHRYVDEFAFRLNEGNVKNHIHLTGSTASLMALRGSGSLTRL